MQLSNSSQLNVSSFNGFDFLVKEVKSGKLITSDYTSVEKFSKIADFFVRLFSFGCYSLEKHYKTNLENVFNKIEMDVNVALSTLDPHKVVKKSDVNKELIRINKVLSAAEENLPDLSFNLSGSIENVPGLNADFSPGSYSIYHLLKRKNQLSKEEVQKEVSILIESAGLSSQKILSLEVCSTKCIVKICYGGGSRPISFKEVSLSEKLQKHYSDVDLKFESKEQMIEKLKESKQKIESLLQDAVEDPAAEFQNLKNSLLEKIKPLMSICVEKNRMEKSKKDSLEVIYNRVLNTLKTND